MRHPRALLVDLDDTILDDSGSVDSAWRTACFDASSRVDGLDPDALLDSISRVRDWYWSDPDRHREGRLDLRASRRRIVQQALQCLGVDHPGLVREIAESYRDIRDASVRSFPGAIETLDQLRASGVKLALITNGGAEGQRAKIERFDLERRFDHIQIEGEAGFGKPDPRAYLAVMQALASSPEDTWCVGDNLEWEVADPQALGIWSIWVDRAGVGLPEGSAIVPDRIINSLIELKPP